MKITGHGTISSETFRFDFGNDGLAVGRKVCRNASWDDSGPQTRKQSLSTEVLANKMY